MIIKYKMFENVLNVLNVLIGLIDLYCSLFYCIAL